MSSGKNRKLWPVRFRLTLSFLLALGLVLVVIEWVDERALSALLDRVTLEDMDIKIGEVKSAVRTLASARDLPEALSLDGTMVQIMSPRGTIVSRTSNLRGDDLPVPHWHREKLQMEGALVSGPAMVATASLAIRHNPGYWAVLGIPLDEFRAAKARKRVSGGIALLIGLLLTGLVGYFLSGLALRPVERLRADVEAIEAEDMRRRIDLSRIPDDELGRLGATFNDLLDRVAAARAKQQHFVENASHDLRSPLTAIAGHAQLLLKRGRQDPTLWERPLKAIVKETERLRRLVDDLLILAQPPAPASELQPIELSAVVAEVVVDRAVLQPLIRLGTMRPVLVRIAPDHVRRILGNLLDNAVRAVDAAAARAAEAGRTHGPGEVVVSVLETGDRSRLVVADNGVGISEADQLRVFDRFFRVDGARDKDRGGSGLGLAIVQALAYQYGGAASLESRENQGTTVSIDLPIARTRSTEAPAPETIKA